MEFTDLYTVESLQCFNGFHYRGYRVNQSDTDKVNRLIAIIRQEREKNIGPAAGDIIEYTCRNGDWFQSAHIEEICDGHFKICLSGSIPFCYESGDGVGYNIHEGIWTYPKRAALRPAGIREKQFRTWGTCRKMRQRGGILHSLCPCVAIYGTGTPVWQIYYQKLEQIPHQQAARPGT